MIIKIEFTLNDTHKTTDDGLQLLNELVAQATTIQELESLTSNMRISLITNEGYELDSDIGEEDEIEEDDENEMEDEDTDDEVEDDDEDEDDED